MSVIGLFLKSAGYRTVNIGYPCRSASLSDCLNHISTKLSMSTQESERLAFVGHSMGGLLATSLASQLAAQGRSIAGVIALGSPFQGSRMAARVLGIPFLGRSLGPALPELAELKCPPVEHFPLLILAGGTGGVGFNPFLPSDNDGIVTVDETRLPGATHEVICGVHSLLVYSRTVMRRIREFLSTR